MQLIPWIKPGARGWQVKKQVIDIFRSLKTELSVNSLLKPLALLQISHFNLYPEKPSVSLIVSTKQMERKVEEFVIKLNIEGNPLTFH